MKVVSKLNCVALLTMIFFLLAGCKQIQSERKIKSIAVDPTSIQESYDLDEFNITTIKLVVTYDNGDVDKIDVSMSMIAKESQEKFKQAGPHLIEVNYQNLETSFTLNLVEITDLDGVTIDDLIKEKTVDIRFRIPFNTVIQQAITNHMNSFKVKYPNVNITLDYIGGYDPMRQATIFDINSGNAPTMIAGYPEHFAEYINLDALVSLDDYIYSQDPLIGYTEDEINDFLAGHMAEVTMFDKDKSIMGLPFNKSTEIMYYNKTFFDHFNLEVPKTWQDLESLSTTIYEIVNTLKDYPNPWLPNIKNHLAKNQFMPLMYDSEVNLFQTIIHQFGGNYTKAVVDEDGVIDLLHGELSFFQDNNAKEALTYMQRLASKNILNIPDVWDGSYGSDYFVEGQILMNISTTASSTFYRNAPFEVGYAPIPYHQNKSITQQGTNVAIMSQASEVERLASWLFIKHCLEPENTAKFAMDTGYLPVRRSSYSLPFYQQFLNGSSATPQIHKVVANHYVNDWEYFVETAWTGSGSLRLEVQSRTSSILVMKDDVQSVFNQIRNSYLSR